MKICKKCGTSHNDYRCLNCAKEYSRKWREEHPCADKIYREENKETLYQKAKERRDANKEKIKERRKELYQKNKNRILEKKRNRRQENLEKIRAAEREWHKKNKIKNPDRAKRMNHARRAKKKNNGGKLSKGIQSKLFSLQKGKCVCCGLPLGNNYHLDHIIPLALGGENSDRNVQLLRAECNMKKSDKHPIDYMQSKGFLL